jgi:pyruvate ferredoxin oxidoreductase gamma subunit
MVEEFLREVRFHARGGQGGWLSSKILAIAAMNEGYNIKAFPEFGPERTGAPTKSFVRYSNQPIRLACGICNPDCVIVIEPKFLETRKEEILEGIKPDGKIIANYGRELEFPNIETRTMDISKLAREKYGIKFANIGILGGYIKFMEDIRLDSMKKAIMDEMTTIDIDRRKDTKVAEVNAKLMEDVYYNMK